MKYLFKFVLMVSVFCSTHMHAKPPEYFTQNIDEEYRALLFHLRDLLPKSDLPLAYLPSFTPFNLLDIHANSLKNDESKRQFINFNFGVLGASMLNVDKQTLAKLPSLAICKKVDCLQRRLTIINQFLQPAADELARFQETAGLSLIQQTSIDVYRINNTFITPAELIVYRPSKEAGFVPSAHFERVSGLEKVPDTKAFSDMLYKLRVLMNQFSVAAITKANNLSIDVIFEGLGDNHWGVVIHSKNSIPKVGDTNHLGLEYDTIQRISQTAFYYQTN